eukprot:366531-Chlamydomonas_euryale.AAC.8
MVRYDNPLCMLGGGRIFGILNKDEYDTFESPQGSALEAILVAKGMHDIRKGHDDPILSALEAQAGRPRRGPGGAQAGPRRGPGGAQAAQAGPRRPRRGPGGTACTTQAPVTHMLTVDQSNEQRSKTVQ